MNSLAKSFFYKCLLPTGLLLAASFFALWIDKTPITIESIESKTETGGKVFNKIQWQQKDGKDIWLMEQSHLGPEAAHHQWDKIAIVVENNHAEFFQLQSGPEEISLKLKPINFKVSCFFCHSNGPRAIRPQLASEQAPINYWNQARLTLWNLKIKTYGKLHSHGGVGERPLRHPHPIANQKLDIKTCNTCHNESSWFARGSLYKQNFMAIGFMVENGHMPPPGFSLNSEEKEKLKKFIQL